MALVLAFGLGVAMAAQGDAAKPTKKPASAKGLMTTPQLVSGEIVSVMAGKSIEIKESSGKLRSYSLSKKTKIEGELKVGQIVEVASAGRWAQEITVQPMPASSH
jgi:hypothetical protein